MSQPERRGWRISPPWRKALLTVHIISAVGLLGTDLAVVTLCISGYNGANPVSVYPAARLLGLALLLPLATLSFATGVVQALLSPWGLFRHWWVTAKFVINLGGLILGPLVLVPALTKLANAANAGQAVAGQFDVIRDGLSATTVLIASVLLAVYKPFGRIGARR
jgi:uncharacterized membrane protein